MIKIITSREAKTIRKLSSNQPSNQSSNQSFRLSKTTAVLTLLFCFVSQVTFARDDLLTLPVSGIFDNPEYSAQLEGVQFFFGETPHPAIALDHGEFTSNKKTNAFKKSDEFSCNWAMLSALLSLKNRAVGLNADAVVGIRSFYKKNDFRGNAEFQCGAGNIMAGVTMKGRVVKLK